MFEGVISGDRAVSREDILARADRAASGLAAQGIGPGDAVALLLRNDVAFFEASFAATRLGAYPVPLNWHAAAEELAHVLADSGARAVVAHADLVPLLRAAAPDLGTVLVVPTPPEVAAAHRVPGAACAVPAGEVAWDAWLADQEPWSGPAVPAAPSMIYTSGTTGKAKGVRRSTRTPEQVAALKRMNTEVLGIVPGMRTVIPAPLYHTAPNTYALSAVRAHGVAVLQARFDPEELLALIERHRIAQLQLVPTHMIRLLQLPEEVRARYDVSSLEHVVHAAAPCPADVKRAMIEWWGPVIWEYYGSTESGPVTACGSEDWLAHPGTVGRPIGRAEVRIVADDGTPLPPGEVGEVYVRNPDYGDFTYHGSDDRRAEIERDGFITVGDVGSLTEDGFLFLSDRKRDVVISGGVNLYPAEIEEVVHRFPGVADCAVFGIPDRDLGEVLAVAVEPVPGAELDPEAVRAHVAAALGRMKVPRLVEVHEKLPREDSGKIFKRRLREPHWAGTGRSV